MRPVDRRDFEIAIICALRIESDAVEATIDEFWEEDNELHYGKAPGDTNFYTLGRMGQHPVVLAYMPGMGKGSSASVAAGFHNSFPNIQLGLVVGICGGVPQPAHDSAQIFLGDVIVSTRIVQFDLGRQFADRFVRKDTLEDNLGHPNSEIRGFLHQVQGWRARMRLRRNISACIAEICGKEGFSSWTCPPPPKEDKLYHANYRHKHHDLAVCTTCAQCVDADDVVCDTALTLSCEQLQCDEHQLLPRERRRSISVNSHSMNTPIPESVPEIHFGLIGSGNLPMKSALHRDRIATQEELLGFEMEGAGVWDNFPAIIVKGVCDYADSHKNKKWQKYASVTAAACTKALLREWRGINKVSVPTDSKRTAETDQREGKFGSNLGKGVTFNNSGNVGNQAVNQNFRGPVIFGKISGSK